MRSQTEAHTQACARQDFPEWHLGRPTYAVWAIALPDPNVVAHRDRVRAALQPWLLGDGGRQPHVTLQICGFPSAAPSRPDDFGLPALTAQAEALVDCATEPLRLTIGAAFSFSSAACLSVNDPGQQLSRLRQALDQAAASPDDTPYAPHVTVGLYAGTWPLQTVRERLVGLALPELAITVHALEWMCYDSRVIGGPLRTLVRVDLVRGSVQVPDPVALAEVFGSSTSIVKTGAAEGP